MFVLKKGFRLTTSLAFFFPGNECVNLAMAGFLGAGIYFLAAAGYLFSPVLAVIALLLFVCIHFCRIYKQLYSRRRINRLLAKPYTIVLAVSGICYFVTIGFCIYFFVFISDTDLVLSVLGTATYILPLLGCMLWEFLRLFSTVGSIVSFRVYLGGNADIFEPELTVNAETGVKVNSSMLELDRVVKLGREYFTVNDNDDLAIVEYGKQKEEAVVIPKELVTDITFTTVTGRVFRVCYSDNKWKEVTESL